MSNEMVERVARAIADELEMARNWPDYVASARAAIAAMREPTSEMTRVLFFGLDAPGIIGSRMPPDIATLWAKAIDAALNEPGSK